MECIVESSWFTRLLKGNNYKEFMKGFGNIEPERGTTNEPEEDFKKTIGKDIIIAVDRDLNSQINFNEYMLIRKSVMAWL